MQKFRFRLSFRVAILIQLTVCVLLSAGVSSAEIGQKEIVKLIKTEKLSVVNIRTTKTVKPSIRQKHSMRSPYGGHGHKRGLDNFLGRDFFERYFGNMPKKHKEKSLGSGVIIDKDGYIVTNFHVINDADEIVVKTSEGKKYKAKVIGKDKKTDIALIKVDSDKPFPFANMGSSDKIEVGESVIAIGNPFGLEQTVTKGIISAKGRVIGSGPYDDFLQTDASINPGNSGGPLFNMNGDVIGINTAIVASGQGIGFAIPIDMAKTVIKQLRNGGKVVRGWLGVMIQEITPELAKNFKLKDEKGALITEVIKGSPAEKGGMKRGDIVISLDGKKIKNIRELSREAANKPVGDKVKVEVLRKTKKVSLTILMGEYPSDDAALSEGGLSEQTSIGITVQSLTPDIKKSLGLESEVMGVLISKVEMGSPAEEANLRRGDIIVEVNQSPTPDISIYQAAIEKVKPKGTVLFLIKRASGTIFVPVTLE